MTVLLDAAYLAVGLLCVAVIILAIASDISDVFRRYW